MEITSSYDQRLPMEAGAKELIVSIKEEYLSMLNKSDIEGITQILYKIYGMSRISGLLLANLLYWINKDWDKWGQETDFIEFIFQYLGYSRTTIDRYVVVGKMYNEGIVPEMVHDQLFSMPMKSLIPIAKTLEQGYDIEDDVWEKLAYSPDDSSVRKQIRAVKGKEPRAHSLILTIDSDGEIMAMFGNDSTPYYIGYLNIDIKEEKIQFAISRILDNANILRRNDA